MMLRQRDSLLDIIVEPRSVTPPGRVGRGSQPCTAHGSQSEQRSRFAKTLFQPEVGLERIAYRPLRIIAEVGQRVAELVGKLKAILRPVSILSCQTDRNTTARGALEIGLRMIGPVVDIDTVELSPWAMPPKFRAGRLQNCSDISGTSSPKPARLHLDI